jgi:site-specific DNA-cytosine methylase
MKINLLSLFSGIEGFALGLEKAGFEIDKHYTSEVDKYASQITRRNYPGAVELGSVTTVTKKRIKDEINILTFGSPCQDLSIAGKRKGLAGARSGLFLEAIRVIQEIQPSIFIWENVKGAFSSNNGRDFMEVLRQFANLRDYEYGEWQLLNTRWVLPQNRERIYFVGHLREASFGKVFPIGERKRKINAQSIQKRSRTYLNPLFTVSMSEKSRRDIAGRRRIRDLTPVEYERLQSFPDGWTAKGIDENGNGIEISDTQRYKCCGNAVTADIVALIGVRLLKRKVKND